MQPDAAKIMQTRRLILEQLNKTYPSPMRVGAIYNNIVYFDEHYDDVLLGKDIAYLREEGYLIYIDKPVGGDAKPIRERFVRLTSQGNKIANNILSDPALEI